MRVPVRGDYHRYDAKTGEAIKAGMSAKVGFPDHYKK
jgi:hypothetical protein